MGRRWVSPLRYPGGKARMTPFLTDLFVQQHGVLLDIEVWIEPFAGGAGAGLGLLDQGVITDLWLVERNPGLAAFWRTVAHDGERFAATVRSTTASMKTWHHSREVLAAREAGESVDDDALALAAFVVNRCSRSGMVNSKVGPIGGKGQSGRWTVESRWSPGSLADRIEHIARSGSGILIHEVDAIDYISELTGSGVEDEVFLFVDPPYVREGNGLYQHGMSMDQHQDLADALRSCPAPWLLTYDDEPVVKDVLYPEERIIEYDIAHTANKQRIDREWAVLSDRTCFPFSDPSLLPTGACRWLRGAGRDDGNRTQAS